MNAATQRNTATASRGDSPDSSREGQSKEKVPGRPQPQTPAEWKRFYLAEYQQAADDGYSGMDFDHERHGMYTSPKHAAYVVGRWLLDTRQGAPVTARPSRGDLLKVGDMTVRIHWTNVKFPRITREV